MISKISYSVKLKANFLPLSSLSLCFPSGFASAKYFRLPKPIDKSVCVHNDCILIRTLWARTAFCIDLIVRFASSGPITAVHLFHWLKATSSFWTGEVQQLIWGRWVLCFCVVEDFSLHSIQLFQVVHRPVYNRHVVCKGWQSNQINHALCRNSLAVSSLMSLEFWSACSLVPRNL